MISKQVIFVLFRSETFTVAAKLRANLTAEVARARPCQIMLGSQGFRRLYSDRAAWNVSTDTSVVSENAATLICCKAPEMLKKLNPIFRQHAVDEIMTEFLKFFG